MTKPYQIKIPYDTGTLKSWLMQVTNVGRTS